MKVLLIQPSYPFSEFPKPSSALLSLGTLLQSEGVEVEILDLLSTRCTPEKIEKRLTRFQPQVVGVTSVTMNFPTAVKTIQACKKMDPEITTIMGGPHVTFTSEETLRAFPEVDIVVRGEGEETMRELLPALERGESLGKIQGVTFRENGSIRKTGSRPLISDLDRLPLPDRTLFPLSRYLAMRVPVSVLSSRGCPMDCSFCVGYRMTGRKGRFRDPLRVVDEIESARRLGFEEVCIDDDLFTRNRRHVFTICDEMGRRGLKMNMYIFARVDTVDEPLLRKLREAGCTMICFGLESGNQKILDRARKRITLEKVRRAVTLSKEAGISPFGSFILGLPGETRQTVEETLAFAQSLGIPYGFHLLAPFPGTEIRERAAQYGIRILTDDWSLYDADHGVTETEGISAQEVENFAQTFFRKLGAEIEKMRQGALAGTYQGPYLEEMEKRVEVDFVWKLLAGDLIEEQGEIPRSEMSSLQEGRTPLEALARRLAGIVDMPLPFVGKKLQKLSRRGLILCQKGTDSFRWNWKEI
jgi:anaerobic magnesium-protoporphyrin IX monomethyl ester cyclase